MWNMFKVNNNDITDATLVFFLLIFSSASNADFEQANVSWKMSSDHNFASFTVSHVLPI